jgi:hypothetical protein
MPHVLRAVAVTLAALVLFTVGAVAQDGKPVEKPVNVAGKWNMELQLSFGPASPTIVLKQDESKLTGTYTGRYGDAPVTGTIKGRAIQFMVKINAEGQDAEMDFTGEVTGDAQSMKGALQITGLDDATWTATRAKGLAPRP